MGQMGLLADAIYRSKASHMITASQRYGVLYMEGTGIEMYDQANVASANLNVDCFRPYPD